MRQWFRRAAPAALVGLSVSAAGLFLPSPAQAVSPDVVISQVYGGGGLPGASFTHDFVELHNTSSAPVDLSTWSVQYGSAMGVFTQRVNLTGSIAGGGYHLVQLHSAGTIGAPLPTPNAVGTFDMANANGKVALVVNQTLLACAPTFCPTDPAVRDLVGYGTAANEYEGSGRAPTLSAILAAVRRELGEADTDDNSADFTAAAPAPRNAASPVVADLAVTKVDDRDPIVAGRQLTYTVTVANEGPGAAQTVEMADTIPAGTAFAAATAPSGWTLATPPVGAAGTVTAVKASVADGESAQFTITVTVGAATTGPLSNTASVSGVATDPDAGDNSAAADTAVQPGSADLALLKIDTSGDPVAAGSLLTYTIQVRNDGPDAAQQVRLHDTIPAGTTFSSFTSPAGWTATTPAVGGTGEVTATKPSMADDETAQFALTVAVDATATGTILNSSGITSTTPDPDLDDNADRERTTIAPPGPVCTITGTERGDIIDGTSGDDVICGLGGRDIINGRGGNDTIYGGPGGDFLSGGTGDDTVYGEAGTDIVGVEDEVRGNDTADGGTGFDLCGSDPLDITVSCP